MRPRLDELEAMVRSRICRECEVRTAEGACDLPENETCKLFELFPLVAQAILATDSDDIQDYIRAIRENVCSVCLDQRLDGECALRGRMRCALDSHLVAIVEVIEEATGKSFRRDSLTA
ncbi:MAG: hypothetical protein RMI94_15545 [Bryobacterales bacterium]|nr:hypothetical protein [Bryobacteraceae bacterium]MDW8131962.1 hypothetical protein [Bryobacterales bacterium]